jgi:hypothetical protein
VFDTCDVVAGLGFGFKICFGEMCGGLVLCKVGGDLTLL